MVVLKSSVLSKPLPRKPVYRFSFLTLLLVTVTAVPGVLESRGDRGSTGSVSTREVRYHGIRPSDPGGRCGLSNPERGFRLESYIGHPPGSALWGRGDFLRDRAPEGFTEDWWLLNLQHYKHHGITLMQAYCYLDEFVDEPLSTEKLSLIEQSFNRCREAGVKILLRFAYEKNMKRESGPTPDRILRHLDQLEPLIREHADIIHVLQAGFVGAWGEWHHSTHRIEEDPSALAAIVKRELEILPRDRMIQLRVLPRYKRRVLTDPLLDAWVPVTGNNAFSGIPAARIGLADDGFLAEGTDGGTWPEEPWFANPGNPEFDAFTKESPFLAVDGELYWSDQGGEVDGMEAAKRMMLHHYTSFSIAHSYSGYEGKPFSIDRWMEERLTQADLKRENLPVSDRYFEDSSGKPIERTVFEYIRDHLGYRIELRSARFPARVPCGFEVPVEIKLVNRGFATFVNPRPVFLVLIDTAGSIVRREPVEIDPREWQPYRPGDPDATPLTHTITETLSTTGLTEGEVMVGLWMPDACERLRKDARYSVRVANGDVPWWTTPSGEYGVNILGTVRLVEPPSR